MNPDWYALYTHSRAEKKVKDRLDTMGVTNYLPLHRAPRTWSDRVKIIDKPLFPSYIFVHCCASELYPLLHVYGVYRIVLYCGKPAVISQREIDAIAQFLKLADSRPLCEGDEVEILIGAFKHVTGKIQKIKKKYLILYIEALNSMVSVDISGVAPTDRIR